MTEGMAQMKKTHSKMAKAMKGFVFSATLFAGLCASIAQAAILKQDVTIDDEYLRLGHVFEGVTEHEDFILAPAPVPGESLVLNAYDLNQISASFGLGWQTNNVFQKLEIRRDATLVDASDINAALEAHIARNLNLSDFEVELANKRQGFVLSAEYGKHLSVQDFDHDIRTGFFTGSIKLADGQEHAINGRIVPMVEVPVLVERLRSGDIIREDMVAWMRVPEDSLNSNSITDIRDLVGMTPRRHVRDMDILSKTDIQAPRVVKKGDLVTMILSDGRLQLTAKGKALDHGAKGDVIRILNRSSNRIIEGRVTGSQSVAVSNHSDNRIF